MACKSKLVLENDADGKLVAWDLKCEGDCPKGKSCERRRVHHGKTDDGGDRYIFFCSCNDQIDHDKHCQLVVYEELRQPQKSRFWARCLGHCEGNVAMHCRPLVVKEFKVAVTDKNDDFQLDEPSFNTVRHIVCTCQSDFI